MKPLAAAGLLVVLSALAGPARAFDWAALWQRDDQRSRAAIDAGDTARALELAPGDAERALANYRHGDFAAAATGYRAVEDHYNAGTALVQAGDYAGAISHFDRAIERNPDDLAAIDNRGIAEQLLELQEQEEQDGEQSGDQSGDQGGEPPPGEQGEESGDDPARPQSDTQPPSGEDTDGDGQSADGEPGEAPGAPPPALSPGEEERQQATDQWLQRVPDDPGGLLRARILREHRREHSGLQAGERAW